MENCLSVVGQSALDKKMPLEIICQDFLRPEQSLALCTSHWETHVKERYFGIGYFCSHNRLHTGGPPGPPVCRHLLMPKMYALLHRSTPLTLSPAAHCPQWNETFITPWCGGANGNRPSSIPSMRPWPLNHGAGRTEGKKQLAGWCSRPLFHLCSPEWVKQKMCGIFSLKRNVQTYSWSGQSTSHQILGQFTPPPKKITEVSPIFCSPLCCWRLWRLSYHCNRYGVSWLRRTRSKTLTDTHPSEGSYWAKTRLWREINSSSIARAKEAEDFSTEEQRTRSPDGDRVQTHMKARKCCCGFFH